MPRVCTVCSHPERQAIDAALIQSTPNRRIAARYTLNEGSVRRHAASHLTETLRKGALAAAAKKPENIAEAARAEALFTTKQENEAAEVAHADDLIAKVHKLATDAQRIATAAEASKDFRTALAGVRELTRIVELLAKLRGDLDESPKVNIVNVDPSRKAELLEALAAKIANAAATVVQVVPGLPERGHAPATVIDVEPE